MKILDLFTEANPFVVQPNQLNIFTKKELDAIKDFLPSFEEFSECGKDFRLAEYPVFTVDNGRTVSTQIYKMPEDGKIPKGAYIYSFSRTPAIYKSFVPSPKNVPSVTPTMYSPEDFVPRKYITLGYDVELPTGVDTETAEQAIKAKLHRELDLVLANPEKYMPAPHYCLMVRMYDPNK